MRIRNPTLCVVMTFIVVGCSKPSKRVVARPFGVLGKLLEAGHTYTGIEAL